MALSAEVFGDSVRLLGKFVDEDGNPGFVIQQNFVHGDPEPPNPTTTEISEYLDTLGFQPVPGKPGRFLNDDEGVEIDDTHPGNFIRSTDGSLQPIDLMIRRTPTPGLRRKIQSSLDDAAPHPGVWTDITNYGRAIFGKGRDFVDWSVRMVKDLGKKITPYLRTIFHAINGGPWNDPKRIRAGIDARPFSRTEKNRTVDQEFRTPFRPRPHEERIYLSRPKYFRRPRPETQYIEEKPDPLRTRETENKNKSDPNRLKNLSAKDVKAAITEGVKETPKKTESPN